MAYGTGEIPFIRTSDISNWEIKVDPKHLVSDEIYKQFSYKQDVKEGDILFVKDGTYLIGTCGYISKFDTKILYQSHLYKIRSLDWKFLSPFLLLPLLSSEIVKRQIQTKRFSQDIIDSIGNRIKELILPIPKQKEIVVETERKVKKAIDNRINSRELAKEATRNVISL